MHAPNSITIAGNLTADPEVRGTEATGPIVKLRVAVSRRVQDTESGRWEDRNEGYFTVTCWRNLARHAARSLSKGDRVVVTGRLQHRTYEVTTEAGTETRSSTEIQADDVGGSFRWTPWSPVDVRPLAADPQDALARPGRDADAEDDGEDEATAGPGVTAAA